MEAQTRTSAGNGSSVAESPVDDHTYNVLQALTSSLEAIEAYGTYREDEKGQLFARLLEDERSHAELLLDELRECLAGQARTGADY
jgi:hypothetical protein